MLAIIHTNLSGALIRDIRQHTANAFSDHKVQSAFLIPGFTQSVTVPPTPADNSLQNNINF
ncbi:hypothetical protein, partial [Pantoea eucalypti]|uniref:hypothetical protein n=1 Tax=Pantoea eucalypti TaxID=470933 RepID=UPI00289955BE